MKNNPYLDKRSIMQVLGCLKTNTNLLTRTDKYIFNEDDFSEDFYIMIFGILQNLKTQGLKKIDLLDIDNYLATRPGARKLYEDSKGAEYINEISEIADITKFDYYYQRLKKMTILRMYREYGVDISWLYDPNTLDINLKQSQEDWLDSVDGQAIVNAVYKKLDEVKSAYLNGDGNEKVLAGENIFELIEDLKSTPEVGVPMFGPLINTVTRGARLKKFYLRSAPSGVGKAIPNDTLIPTPQGMRLVGDIKQGDFIFGQDGKPTKVLQVHPQKEQKEIWEITFADGRKAKSCSEHLWEYRYDSHRKKEYRVEDIQTIYNRTLKLKNGLKNANNRGYRFHIRTNKPVEYRKKDFGVDPYVMGMALGDGSFRYNNTNKAFVFSSGDEDMVQAMADLLQADYKKNSDFNFGYVFKPKYNTKHNLWVEEIFKEYPKLWNVKSEEKFIPEEYMQGSIEQRLSLLQGLLDTDGGIDDKGRVSFTTVSPQLRDQIILLANSLGMTGSYGVDKRKDKYTTGECYNIKIQAKKSMKPLMFRLKRKVDIATKYASSSKREEYKDHLAIVDIKPTKEKTDMTCFTVDNKDSLFLMNDYIVTHNTRMMIADACNFACNEIYDIYTKSWVPNGTAEPTLYITTEQELDEIQTMMLAFLSGVDEDHILTGRYLSGEEERVKYAGALLQKSSLWVEELPDFSLNDIENKMRSYVLDQNVKYVFFDYIHTSLKIMEEITRKTGGIKLREDQILYMLAIRLKDLANELGIFVLSSTQLNADWEEKRDGNQNLLRGAKAIADKVDFGAIVLPVTEDDLKCLEPLLSSGVITRPNLVYHIYKNRRSQHSGVKLWCSANLGICRVSPIFMTNNTYKVIPIENYKIIVEEEEKANDVFVLQ